MAGRVFLHPGPPKTGTTYIQSLLYANTESLRAQGVTMVGSQAGHFAAASDLLRTTSRRGAKVPDGAWTTMLHRVRRCEGAAILSCERYSLLRATQISRVVEDLADRELHVVLTLRDVAAVLPARWQEALKNGSSTPWSTFCDQVATDARALSRAVRAVSTIRLWSQALPAERVHVVTVPPSTASRTLLLERFCEAVGVDSAKLATLETARVNASLDLAAAEVVRRLNAAGLGLSARTHHAEVKSFLAGQVLSATRHAERPRLTSAAYAAARAEGDRVVAQIRAAGIPVIGDLADLAWTRPPGTPTTQEIDPEAVVDAAMAAIAALARRSAQRGRSVRALERDVRRLRADIPPARSWPAVLRRGRLSRPGRASGASG